MDSVHRTESSREWARWHPPVGATMVVHSDGCAFPDAAKKFYSELRGEKELVWADGTHFDYYDSQAQIDNAVANVTRFFRTHLAEELAA
jgi:ABC-type oligopeptide transport system substrate-binding subunit